MSDETATINKSRHFISLVLIVLVLSSGCVTKSGGETTLPPLTTLSKPTSSLKPVVTTMPSTSTPSTPINVVGTTVDAYDTLQDALDKPVRVEVYHFHGNHQCYSCRTIGAYAEKTVNTFFKEELGSGRLVFDHINFDLPENKDLAVKYGVTGSSLWIGTYIGDEFNKEQDTQVWYKIAKESDYIEYLTGVIEKRISGDLS